MNGGALRLVLALGALLAATALAAGCGGSEASAPVFGDLAQVAERTTEARTASFALQLDEGLGPRTFSISADGAFDAAASRSRLSVDLSGLATLFPGIGIALGGPGAPALDDPATWRLQVIHDGSTVYLSSPLLHRLLPNGKTWLSADVEQVAAEHGLDLGQLGAAGSIDPSDVLDLLRAASGELQVVGTETVRGVETTHYRAALDPEKLLELGGPGADDRLVEAVADAIEESGLDEIPVDAWVDDDALLRRVDASVSLEREGERRTSSLSLELFDYGERVDVRPPPPDEVADLGELRHP